MYALVDMDSTLIFSPYETTKSEDSHVAVYGNSVENVIVRPRAREFLSDISKHCSSVILATMSSRRRAESILKVTGLDVFFKSIYCREDFEENIDSTLMGEFSGVDLNREFFLVDDMPFYSDIVRYKFLFFGLQEAYFKDHIIPVPEFSGDPNDRHLLSVLARAVGFIQRRANYQF